MGSLIDPFLDNEFMVRALIAGVLVSLACAVIGTYVVLRGMAFIGDALAHGVLPGVALALLVGLPTLLGASLGAGVMIGGVGLVTKRSRLSSDSAIGLLFIGLLALGVVMVSSSDSLGTSLEAILFGEFLGVDDADLVIQAIAAAVVGLVALWSARPFLLLCFDRDQAKVMGFRADAYHRLMLVLVAGTIVVSFQTVGSLLVFGMLLAPAGVGALVARRVGVMMLWAALTGSLATYVGLLLSYHYAWAAGASVVLVAVAMFFVVLLVTSFRSRVGAHA